MNLWILIAESGNITEVPSYTPNAIEVAPDELATLQKGIMSDEQLQASVSKGFANPDHMSELLKRSDIPLSTIKRVRINLSSAISNSKISLGNLQAIISKLKSTKTVDEFNQVFAELRHANRLVHLGTVAENSLIFTSAKKGNDYTLGLTKVKIDPISEADILYLGKDGIIHIDEVKNTEDSLASKTLENSGAIRENKRMAQLRFG